VLWNTAQQTSLCLEIETRCDENESCFDVEVGTIPELPSIFGGSSLCPGETTTLYTPEQDPDDTLCVVASPNVNLISGSGTNEIEIEWAGEGDAEICVAITNACGTNDNCTCCPVPTYDILFDTVICSGSTFYINGHAYGNGILSGVEYMVTSHGCDSIVEVEVMEASVLIYDITENLCPGDSIFLQGAFQDQTGTYVDSFLTASGCDSIVITQLFITPFDTTCSTLLRATPRLMEFLLHPIQMEIVTARSFSKLILLFRIQRTCFLLRVHGGYPIYHKPFFQSLWM
jgi:hypothetical protein